MLGFRAKRTASEVAVYLRDFIDGTGGDWDWDDFTSVSIADPHLETIRKRALAVDLPIDSEGLALLSDLRDEAARLAANA